MGGEKNPKEALTYSHNKAETIYPVLIKTYKSDKRHTNLKPQNLGNSSRPFSIIWFRGVTIKKT